MIHHLCGKNMIQKCKFQKRNDPPICVISFLELTSLDHFFTQIGGSIWCFVLALCVTITTRWIITCLHRWSGKSWIICVMSEPSSPAPRAVHVSELVVRKIADHFARQGRGGGGFMGWVIHDPRIIWWGGRGGFLDPRGSVIRGPPTTHSSVRLKSLVKIFQNPLRLSILLRHPHDAA